MSDVAYGPHPRPDMWHPSLCAYVEIVLESYNFDPLTEEVVNGLNCTTMRDMLARRGLTMTGNKATLRNRLLTTTPNVPKVKLDLRRKVHFTIMADIRRYGEDGYGDKPVHMDTVVYWLSHHDPEKFVG
eukprot:COSAG02_NODE_1005_length_15270_cov_11.414607_13_plen_129_part_00